MSSWLPYPSVNEESKFCGVLSRQAHRQLLTAVVLDGQLILEARLQVAAQIGKLRRQAQLGWQILGKRYRNRQRSVRRASGRGDREGFGADGRGFRHVQPQFQRNIGIGRRHCRSDGLAATHQRRRPTGRHAGNQQAKPLGRQVVILQLQIDRGGLAGPQRHRRIVAHQIQAHDVIGGVFADVLALGNGRDWSRERGEQNGKKNGKTGDKAISHWCWLPCRNGRCASSHGTLSEHGRGSRHCGRNRDKFMQTTALLARPDWKRPAVESRSLSIK